MAFGALKLVPLPSLCDFTLGQGDCGVCGSNYYGIILHAYTHRLSLGLSAVTRCSLWYVIPVLYICRVTGCGYPVK